MASRAGYPKANKNGRARYGMNKGADWAEAIKELLPAGCMGLLKNRCYRLPSPKGWYVYLMLGHDDQILYVGQSRNIYVRLGTHMANREKFDRVDHIEFVPCKHRQHMDDLEQTLIRVIRPPWNIIYNPDANGAAHEDFHGVPPEPAEGIRRGRNYQLR